MSNFVKGTFEYIEALILSEAGDDKGNIKGALFEKLIHWYLQNAPEYDGVFSNVWLWNDWPDRPGPDIKGIDIVAKTNEGDLWAVQVKAHAPNVYIKKTDIDKFLTGSGTKQFSCRLFFASTDLLGPNAREVVFGKRGQWMKQEKPLRMILRGKLSRADVIWPSKIGESPNKQKPHSPLPYQNIAIKDVLNGFSNEDAGKLIMACGTGKTLVSQRADEKMGNRLTLNLVPTISLLDQVYKNWKRHAKVGFKSMVVCSDRDLQAKGSDQDPTSPHDLSYLTHDKSENISTFLDSFRDEKKVVFSTYHSLPLVAKALESSPSTFDLVIADEAHKTVSLKNKSKSSDNRFFTLVHDREKIRAKKRLFMTATPRFVHDYIRKRVEDLGEQIVDMSDKEFGEEFHKLTFGQAIKQKILADYRLVCFAVTNNDIKRLVDNRTLLALEDAGITDARHIGAMIGLAKAINKHSLSKILTFHRRIKNAKRIAEGDNPESLISISKAFLGKSKLNRKIWSRWITAEKTSSQRETIFQTFEDLPRDVVGLISNCQCLGEGVDIPELDGVAFIDPRKSETDTIQAVGRVIRKKDRKGTIVIPVFTDKDESTEEQIEKSEFSNLWYVIRALRAHDEVLADELDALRTKLGKRVSRSTGKIVLPSKLILDIPSEISSDFVNEIFAKTIERITPLPPLTYNIILSWADNFYHKNGSWPTSNSGDVSESPGETWSNVSQAIRLGLRGLQKNKSLANLLLEERGVQHHLSVPDLTIAQILEWAEIHYEHHKEWPTQASGVVRGAVGESWRNIEASLRNGNRGLEGGSSIAKLLAEQKGKRNISSLPELSHEQILIWAKEYFLLNGNYPSQRCGDVIPDSGGETWSGVQNAMRKGRRGLKKETFEQLLHRLKLKENRNEKLTLTNKQILQLADKFKEKEGRYPKRDSGTIEGTSETWSAINQALIKGNRGLKAGSSLAKLLEKERKVTNKSNLRQFNENEIWRWIEEFAEENNKWPTVNSGLLNGHNDITWKKISGWLHRGLRGLSKAGSLDSFLRKNLEAKVVKLKLEGLKTSEVAKRIRMDEAFVYEALRLDHVKKAIKLGSEEIRKTEM